MVAAMISPLSNDCSGTFPGALPVYREKFPRYPHGVPNYEWAYRIRAISSMVHSSLEARASAELAKLGILPYIFSAILLKSINQNFKNDLQEFLRDLEEFDLKRLQ
jgi:hypothetical protein